MVDTPKGSDNEEQEETAEDDPSKKQTKRRHRRRSKSRLGKNSDNSARENNTPVDSRGNDDHIAPAAEHDEAANGEHSTDPTSKHGDAEDKPHQTPSGEENSSDEDAHIIPETHLEQENLRRRLIATARSLVTPPIQSYTNHARKCVRSRSGTHGKISQHNSKT